MECVENGKLVPFPSEMVRSSRLLRKEKVKLYCDCKLPDDGEENMAYCVKCKNWFHESCQSIVSVVFESDDLTHKTGCAIIVQEMTLTYIN